MSKAEQIRTLLEAGVTPVDIAAKVGCLPQYVYAVRRRDFFGGQTPADRRWQSSRKYKKQRSEYHHKRYRFDPEYKARKLETSRNWKSHGQAS